MTLPLAPAHGKGLPAVTETLTACAAPSAATDRAHSPPACRLCGARLYRSLIDLGSLPLSNRTVATDATRDAVYPLHARICDDCTLVQVADVLPADAVATPEPHLSSRSPTRVEQARRFAETMRKRLRLDADSLVIEIGSNDGYLLRHFLAAGIPVLGVDPATRAAAVANDLGIPTEVASFDSAMAMEIAVRHGRADLVIANNVLPHVPDLFDFAAGFAGILRPNGVLTLQVPHLLALVQGLQFDAFRHDTYVYLSLRVVERVLRSVGLRVFDAERMPGNSGTLRVHACHAIGRYTPKPGLKVVRLAESGAEADRTDLYTGFHDRAAAVRNEVLAFLRTRREAGRRVVAYGAATRGSTMLNACGISTREIECVADSDPAKQGRYLPGSRIPIVPLDRLLENPPNDVVILPWTHIADVTVPLQALRHRGSHLWAAVPRISRV